MAVILILVYSIKMTRLVRDRNGKQNHRCKQIIREVFKFGLPRSKYIPYLQIFDTTDRIILHLQHKTERKRDTVAKPFVEDLKIYLRQVAFQSNENHPLAESMGYIKFEGM